jgi:hypothetical protein
VWRACLDAVGSLPGNPLGVVVEPVSDIPLGMVGAIDSAEINRVIGLGIVRDEVELMVGFCRLHAGSHFGIELSPDAQPVDVRRWLTEADLHPSPGGVSKMGSDITEIPPPHGDLNVCRLDEEHRAAVGELSVLEWGGWSDGGVLRHWFQAPVGSVDFHHYGVFGGDRLVAVGALVVHGELAWLGFDATHPRYWRHDLRSAITLTRVDVARRVGCRYVHAEIATRFASSPKRLFRRLYDRERYSPAPSR